MQRSGSPRLLALASEPAARALDEAARASGFELTQVRELADLLRHLQEDGWACTILSLTIDPVDEAVARRVGAEGNAGALLLSAGSVSLSVALLGQRVGAVAVLHEPLEAGQLEARLREVTTEGKDVAIPAIAPADEEPTLIGDSRAMSEVFETVARVAKSRTTVLLTGESGTGKEVVARAIHAASERAAKPFVAVNCAAIPEQLLESELFGHEKGAFTGAVGRRRGRFERADGGTLFLDEIGDMSLVLQAKLLRALEESSVEPVGSESPKAVEVRAIAATNQHLSEAISAGRFREDLYYRLAVVEVSLPPLRDREGDVRRLAFHFASHFAQRHGRQIRAMSSRAVTQLEAYSWPGNVRELRNVIDRAVLLSRGDVIQSSALRLGPRVTDDGTQRGALGWRISDHRVAARRGGRPHRARAPLGRRPPLEGRDDPGHPQEHPHPKAARVRDRASEVGWREMTRLAAARPVLVRSGPF